MTQNIVLANNYSTLKKAIWFYFWLWLLEGALRKWVLPGLSTPLLVVRDPIAIYICYLAIKQKLHYHNSYVVIGYFSCIFAFILSLLIGHQNLLVGLYGARIYLFHFPLVFIIGKIFTAEDVLKFGKIMLLLMIPMSVIIILQFSSPQSAWINRGVGGDISGAGFTGAMGYSRPPGTFSFISGLVNFIKLYTPFLVFFLMGYSKCSKWILFGSAITFLLALPLTISRGAVASVILVVIFATFTALRKTENLYRIIVACFFVFLLIVLALQIELFKLGIEVFLARFEAAANSEGNVSEIAQNRVLGGILGGISDIFQQPLFSGNLGIGSNVAAKLLTGQRAFLGGEGALGQMAFEYGLIFGLLLFIMRLLLAINFAIKSWSVVRYGGPLAWLLVPNVIFILAFGGFNLTYDLGYFVMAAGLLIASLKFKSLSGK